MTVRSAASSSQGLQLQTPSSARRMAWPSSAQRWAGLPSNRCAPSSCGICRKTAEPPKAAASLRSSEKPCGRNSSSRHASPSACPKQGKIQLKSLQGFGAGAPGPGRRRKNGPREILACDTSKGMSFRSTMSTACKASLPWKSLAPLPLKRTETKNWMRRTNKCLMKTGVGASKSSYSGQGGSPSTGSWLSPATAAMSCSPSVLQCCFRDRKELKKGTRGSARRSRSSPNSASWKELRVSRRSSIGCTSIFKLSTSK
mmetsp:Transcript_20738/g.49180  ORF Transcript_20738/g.49180 Transcript_20738/m.49180 type:complete len:257 (+) Transcript_20738:873-1643(+)